MIGSIIGGLIGQSGANAGAAASMNAANQAWLGNQHQMAVNRSDASPWVSSGRSALNQIGALLGWGTLKNPGQDGTTWEWDASNGTTDQRAAGQALNQFSAWAPKLAQLNVSDKFEADPGYQFRLSEGSKALDRSASARGMRLSGGQAKALTDYNQGMGAQEYGNWWNRYTSATAANNATKMQDYQNTVGNYLNLLGGLSSGGQSAQAGVASANSGLQASAGNYLTSAGQAAGNMYMQGANSLASGIGSGINNTLAAGYLFGGFGGGGRSSYGNLSGFGNGQGPMGPSGRY